ncbi:MAG TPA: hypothetical protein VKU80_14155 [Planctomycetota bacterium]|nr:hypothetical protein [Planctomycetota bacterium]
MSGSSRIDFRSALDHVIPGAPLLKSPFNPADSPADGERHRRRKVNAAARLEELNALMLAAPSVRRALKQEPT